MTTVEFSFARADDEKAIKGLLLDCDLPVEDVREHLGNFLLARVGGKLAGAVGLQVLGSAGLLRSLAVKKAYRERGIGEALCRSIELHAHNQGVRKLFLLTTKAQNFFSRKKFSRIERAKAPREIRATLEFRKLCPESATVMSKEL